MSDENWVWSFDQKIPSSTEVGAQVIQEVLEQLEKQPWLVPGMFGVNLAIEEALVNAIKHGNKEDEAKKVHFICKISSNRLFIEIADEGEGFIPEDVPDPTEDDNLDRPGGRGIMLMRSFMSSVEYNDNGTRVVMEKMAEAE